MLKQDRAQKVYSVVFVGEVTLYSDLDLENSRLTSLSKDIRAVHSPLIVLGISRSEHNPVRGAAGRPAESRRTTQ